jgi:hypothetical protein
MTFIQLAPSNLTTFGLTLFENYTYLNQNEHTEIIKDKLIKNILKKGFFTLLGHIYYYIQIW